MRRLLFVAMVLVALDGCVRRYDHGTEQVFTYELWVPLSVLLAGIVAVPAGWYLRRVSRRIGWVVLVMAPIAVVFFAPSLFCDRVTIEKKGFTVRTGLWGLTAVHEVTFDSIRRVRITSEERTGRYGTKRTYHYLVCEKKGGSSAKVPVNNELCEAAAPHILRAIKDRGIEVLDETR